jgi:hypothetical protein
MKMLSYARSPLMVKVYEVPAVEELVIITMISRIETYLAV